MRNLMLAVALFCSAAVYAHTPVCRCELNGDRLIAKAVTTMVPEPWM